jgi:hypothetical protein
MSHSRPFVASAPPSNGAAQHAATGLRPPRPGAAVSERVPVPPRRRRPATAALGVLIILGSAGVSGALVLRGDDTTAVLTITRAVPAGHVMTSGDLAPAEISGTGVTGVAATSRAEVVGMTAAVGLVPGALLSPGMLTDDPVPGPGQAVVGLALKPGLLPVTELTPGARVMVVRVVAPGGPQPPVEPSAGPSSDVLVPEASVLSVAPDQTGGGWLVSIVVDEDAAADVAGAGAAGTAGLVVIAARR